ncbi:MAG: hypothetical protein ACREU8_05550 [Gammaproteobacteria bacterium]
MAPIGSQHAAYVARLQKLLERSAGTKRLSGYRIRWS